ncbi:BEN domain-containing protein 2 [Microcaecilia unicolor]|uniref:BEN domain-containing protein 2 n=1 Tax=Microcaecilia unicolor TaxID=1415580 RepID=A0A6P7Y4W8_9AMPH|nr:BEN domain-containing protein 2 [Microcaecilia unicolor]
MKVEDDDDAVIIENSPIVDIQNEISLQGLMPLEQPSSKNHYMTQLSYREDLTAESDPVLSQVSRAGSLQSDSHGAEEIEYEFLHKRRRLSSMVTAREPEYEDTSSVLYEYEPDYECGSVVSEASYSGDQQRILAEVLNYCQIMYDAIQKLDKKFDSLQRKVSEMQHSRMKPFILKPRPVGLSYRSSHPVPLGKVRVPKPMIRESNLQICSPAQGGHSPSLRVRLEKNHVPARLAVNCVPPTALQPELQQTALRLSPPLPTIVSTHSLQPPFSAAPGIPELNVQPKPLEAVTESSGIAASPASSGPLISSVTESSGREKGPVMINYMSSSGSSNSNEELPSSSVTINPSLEYVGDPKRNVRILGNYLMKARQKTKPKYAARYLVRVLFPKETLLCSVMGGSARGRRTLDPNKIAAIREFLAAAFPSYNLNEYGRDWKTCITNVNAMIRCLRCETGRGMGSSEGTEKTVQIPETSICVDSDNNGEDGDVISQTSQKTASSTTNTPWDSDVQEALSASSPNKPQSLEPMECLGKPWRKVQLPFSVIYVAKGKSRPELSARYLVRHLFTEDVLVKSNVYGNVERGMSPLDSNKINAMRDFLQDNYPSFDLNESGYDWKACVAAINGTIRSLRHDLKKSGGAQRKSLLACKRCEKSPPQSPSSVRPGGVDTISLMD